MLSSRIDREGAAYLIEAETPNNSIEFLTLLAERVMPALVEYVKLGVSRVRTQALKQPMPEIERRRAIVEGPD